MACPAGTRSVGTQYGSIVCTGNTCVSHSTMKAQGRHVYDICLGASSEPPSYYYRTTETMYNNDGSVACC